MTEQKTNDACRASALERDARLLVEKNGYLYECQPGPGMWKCGVCLRGVILGAWEKECRVCGAKVQQPNIQGKQPATTNHTKDENNG